MKNTQTIYKKKFGQNFLINEKIINKIIEASNIQSNSEILEIGPGNGSLTKEIIKKKPKKYIAIEIDTSLKNIINKEFFKNTNYELIFSDALKFKEYQKFSNNFTIISNLPYNISLTLLIKWIYNLDKLPHANRMILMFQKEVADRILATNNSKKFGRISVLCSAFFEIKKITDVDKNDFFPVPKVNSTVLMFKTLKSFKFNIKDIKYLEKITNILFNNRRKKLKKKIETLFSPTVIEENMLNRYYDYRVENLTAEIFFKLAAFIKLS